MQYSPLASGIGLLIAGQGLPAGPGILLLARVLLDIAGLCFIAFVLFFAVADMVGRLQSLAAMRRPVPKADGRYPRHLAPGFRRSTFAGTTA